MENIDNAAIKYMEDSKYLIHKLTEAALEKSDANDIIDLYGQIIEALNLFCNYITNLIEAEVLVKDDKIINIKNETILFKEYCINYVDGLLNPNDYIIDKYRKLINDQHDLWLSVIGQYFAFKSKANKK